MCHVMRKPCELTLGLYADLMIDINFYLAAFPGVKSSVNTGEK